MWVVPTKQSRTIQSSAEGQRLLSTGAIDTSRVLETPAPFRDRGVGLRRKWVALGAVITPTGGFCWSGHTEQLGSVPRFVANELDSGRGFRSRAPQVTRRLGSSLSFQGPYGTPGWGPASSRCALPPPPPAPGRGGGVGAPRCPRTRAVACL